MPKTFSNQHITQKSKSPNIIRNTQLVILLYNEDENYKTKNGI